MTTRKAQSLIAKTIAFILVSLCFAWLMHHYSAGQIAKLNSMSATDYAQHKRHVHEASYLAAFIRALVAGGIYLGTVETVACVLRLCIRKRGGAEPVGAGNGGLAGSGAVGSVFIHWGCRAVPDLYR